MICNPIIQELYEAAVIRDPQTIHSKEEWQFLYLQQGSIKLTADDRLYTLLPGEAALLAPRAVHCLQLQKDAQILLIPFQGEDSLFAPFANCAFPLPEGQELADRLAAASHSEDPLEQRSLYPLAELLLLLALQKSPLLQDLSDRNCDAFLQAVALMKESIDQPLSLPALAEELQISLSHLKRLFARFAQMGAHEYSIELRINYAKGLLESGHPVTETAALCGFANQAYFSSAFKKSTNRSPKEFLAKNLTQKVARPKASKPQTPAPKKDMPSYLL